MKKPHAAVRISFRDGPGEMTSPDVTDLVGTECGDFSTEKLEAFIADVNTRITNAWFYMAGRESKKGQDSLPAD